MQINWTSIIGVLVISVSFLIIGWLTPSPFDKKPVSTGTDIVTIDYGIGQEDSTFVIPDPIQIKDTLEQKKPVIIKKKDGDSSLMSPSFEDIFVFEKITQDTATDGTISAFRSTTYYNPLDSTSFTIHEINIEPRPLQVIQRVDTIKVVEVKYIEIPEKVDIIDNKYTYGVAGALLGAVIAIFAIRKG
jgi:hypothetical protein